MGTHTKVNCHSVERRCVQWLGLLLIFVSCFMFCGIDSPIASDLFQYKDGEGRDHFVDSPEKIPERYRDSTFTTKVTAGISTVAGGNDNANLNSSTLRMDRSPKPHNRIGPKRVEIFVTEWCSYCRALEADLKKEKIPFLKYDVEKSARGRALYEQIGGSGYPVTRVNSKVIIKGYALDKIKSALNAPDA